MRKALVVGINYYANLCSLHGCVNDAASVRDILVRHANMAVNFDVKLLTATQATDAVSRAQLKDSVEELFGAAYEIALLYFAGHGCITTTGGYILASDSSREDEGVPLGEVLTLANKSRAKSKVVILDSCHSGVAGSAPDDDGIAVLSKGLTILTASTAEQYANEENNKGVFTALLVEALGGAAANLIGDITPGSVYAHIDQALGAWYQRPVFKTNVENFVSLRTATPPIGLADLLHITKLFPPPSVEHQLDPTYEPRDEGRTPDMPPANPINTSKFAILQKYNRVNLVIPVGAQHMWNAAMESKSCKLTVSGEYYRSLVQKGRL